MLSTIISVAIAALAAYALTRLKFLGAGLLTTAILITYLLPGTLIFIPLYQTLSDMGLINSYGSLLVTYPTFLVPFATWVLIGYFRSIPVELEEAALSEAADDLDHLVHPLAARLPVGAGDLEVLGPGAHADPEGQSVAAQHRSGRGEPAGRDDGAKRLGEGHTEQQLLRQRVEAAQRLPAHVVLHPLDVAVDDPFLQPKVPEQARQNLVPLDDIISQFFAFRCQSDTSVFLVFEQPFCRQPLGHVRHTRLGDFECRRDVHCPSVTLAPDQLRDALQVIFPRRRGFRGLGFACARRLGRGGGLPAATWAARVSQARTGTTPTCSVPSGIFRPTVSLMNSTLRLGIRFLSTATVRMATTLQPSESSAPTPFAPA